MGSNVSCLTKKNESEILFPITIKKGESPGYSEEKQSFNNSFVNSNNKNHYSIISNENDENNLKHKYKFIDSKSYNLVVHRNDGMNDYILEMTLTKVNKNAIHRKADFIMILDVSGSMSSYVHNLVTNIIPRGLNLLNYKDNDNIHLITFESTVKSYNMTVGQLKNDNNIQGMGGTYMSGVYNFVKSILDNNLNQKNYRILVLSDGIIYDQDETKKEAELLKIYLDASDFSISVGSIRYNSSWGSEPDTKAISSVLILNTDITKKRVLTEVSHTDSNETITQKIYELFKDDYFQSDFTIKSDKIKFRLDPWKEGRNEVKLNDGENIIFSDENPSKENVGIYEGGELKYTKDDFKNGYKLTYSNYNDLLGAKINLIARKVRINKTSGSKAALEENKKIINYFENFEKNLPGNTAQEAIIARELRKSNELDISKYNPGQLAQFIGVDNIIEKIPITDFLKKFIKTNDKEEKDVKEFVKNTLKDAKNIDNVFNKLIPI